MSQNKERKREERKDAGRDGGKETGMEEGREKKKEGRMGLSMVTLVVVCSTVFLKMISTVFNPHLHLIPTSLIPLLVKIPAVILRVPHSC